MMRPAQITYALRRAVQGLIRGRGMTLACIGSLTACFLLLGAALLAEDVVRQAANALGDGKITVFLEGWIGEAQTDCISSLLQEEGADNIRYASPEDNLRLMCERLGETPETLLDSPADNPFLASLEARAPSGAAQRLIPLLERERGVTAVQGSSETASALNRLRQSVFLIGMLLFAVLIAVTALIICNTMRISLHQRREEIAVMKSVGATDGMVRAPFFLQGVLMGTVAALLSAGLLRLGGNCLVGTASRTINALLLPLDALPVDGPSFFWGRLTALLLAAGALLGGVGGVVFLRRYLRI